MHKQGYYVFVDMDYIEGDGHLGDPGRLVSPTVTSADEYGLCVSFWYHMYGDYVNELRVFIRQREYESASLWSRKGSKGPQWYYGQVGLLCVLREVKF